MARIKEVSQEPKRSCVCIYNYQQNIQSRPVPYSADCVEARTLLEYDKDKESFSGTNAQLCVCIYVYIYIYIYIYIITNKISSVCDECSIPLGYVILKMVSISCLQHAIEGV
jgi:hypothetical protein